MKDHCPWASPAFAPARRQTVGSKTLPYAYGPRSSLKRTAPQQTCAVARRTLRCNSMQFDCGTTCVSHWPLKTMHPHSAVEEHRLRWKQLLSISHPVDHQSGPASLLNLLSIKSPRPRENLNPKLEGQLRVRWQACRLHATLIEKATNSVSLVSLYQIRSLFVGSSARRAVPRITATAVGAALRGAP